MTTTEFLLWVAERMSIYGEPEVGDRLRELAERFRHE